MRFGRETPRLTADELARLRHCVVEHAAEYESTHAERLVGQLATIRVIASDEPIEFVPPAGPEDLARRAPAAMRASDARRLERTRRFPRDDIRTRV